jgi:hypothetical protein
MTICKEDKIEKYFSSTGDQRTVSQYEEKKENNLRIKKEVSMFLIDYLERCENLEIILPNLSKIKFWLKSSH